MYSAVAPPTSITEGVTVHKGEPKDEELTAPKGRVTSAHLAALQRARAKNVTLSKQLVKEANKKEPAKGIFYIINVILKTNSPPSSFIP